MAPNPKLFAVKAGYYAFGVANGPGVVSLFAEGGWLQYHTQEVGAEGVAIFGRWTDIGAWLQTHQGACEVLSFEPTKFEENEDGSFSVAAEITFKVRATGKVVEVIDNARVVVNDELRIESVDITPSDADRVKAAFAE